MKLLYLLLIFQVAQPMHQRQNTPIVMPSSGDSVLTIESEDEILCTNVLEYINKHRGNSLLDLRSYVKEVVEEQRSSPIADQVSPESLALLASQRAINAQQELLSAITTKVNSQFSKKTTATICGFCTSIVTVVASILVHYNQKCSS